MYQAIYESPRFQEQPAFNLNQSRNFESSMSEQESSFHALTSLENPVHNTAPRNTPLDVIEQKEARPIVETPEPQVGLTKMRRLLSP